MSTVTAVSSESEAISALLLTSLGTDQWGYCLHNLLGSLIGAGLMGFAYTEAYTFIQHSSSDDRPYRWLVLGLLILMSVSGALGMVDALEVVEYWGRYGDWFHRDLIIRYAEFLTISLGTFPVVLMYYSIRAWATNGRSRIIIIAATLDIASMIAIGVWDAVVALRVPWSGKIEDIKANTMDEMKRWGDRQALVFKIWNVFALISMILMGVVVALPLFGLRRRRREASARKFLGEMTWSLLVEIGPVFAVVLAFQVLSLTGDSGGWSRLVGELGSPVFCHAIFHSLASRRSLHLRARVLGLHDPFETTTGTGRQIALIECKTTVQIDISGEDDVEVDIDAISARTRSDSASTVNLSLHRSDPLSGGSKNSAEMNRREIMRYAKAWQSPLSNSYSYSPNGQYLFSLGIKVEPVA